MRGRERVRAEFARTLYEAVLDGMWREVGREWQSIEAMS